MPEEQSDWVRKYFQLEPGQTWAEKYFGIPSGSSWAEKYYGFPYSPNQRFPAQKPKPLPTLEEFAGGLSGQEQRDLQAFDAWIQQIYSPSDAQLIMNDILGGTPLKSNQQYQYWVEQGKPTGTEVTKATQTTGQVPQVVSEGGYDWMPRVNIETGEIEGYDLIGATPKVDTGLSAGQTWQVQQDIWDREQRERELRETQAQRWETQTARALTPGVATDNRAQLAEEWERMRQEIITQLSPSARNWIALSPEVQNTLKASNPFIQQGGFAGGVPVQAGVFEGVQQNMAEAVSGWKTATAIEKMAANDPNRSLSQNEQQLIQNAKDVYAKASMDLVNAHAARAKGRDMAESGALPPGSATNIADELTMEAYWATPKTSGPWAGTAGLQDGAEPQPTTPEIPSWLSRVSGLTGRVPETRVEVQRPSAQMWGKLLPTERDMYAGLVDWSGAKTFESKMAQMLKEIPKESTLGGRWKPAFQV